MNSPAQPAPSATPPRRYHRVARFALRRPWLAGLTLLVLLTFGLRLWWGWRIARQLNQQNALFIARGQPVSLHDVRYPVVPNDENAWRMIEKAATFDDRSAPSNTYVDYPPYPPFPPQWQTAAQKSEVNNAPVLAFARRARNLSQTQARDKLASLVKNTFFLSTLSDARTVANTVGDGALYCNLYFHDDLEAVERLRDMLGIARATLGDDTLVGVLTSAGIDGMATTRILLIAPALTFDRKPTRDAVNSLIRELLDETRLRPAWMAALTSERLMGIEYLEFQSDGNWLLQPLIQKDAALAGRIFDFHERALLAPDAETAIQLLLQSPAATRAEEETDWNAILNNRPRKREIPDYVNWYASAQWQAGMGERYITQLFRMMAAHRMAAVSLATRLYRLDHDNQWPQGLRDLVPKYLPAVPKDPFHADGRPLEYVILRGALPGGGDRPLVSYDESSTGVGPIDNEPMFSLQSEAGNFRKLVRQYRDLSRWSPADRRFDVEQRQAVRQSLQNQLNTLSPGWLDALQEILGHHP